jgi:replication factor C subunit 2/4
MTDSDSSEIKSEVNNSIPWVKKYAPKNISELLVDDLTKKLLESIIEKKEMSNIIITGIPGTGKTTTIKLLVKELLGNNYNQAHLELKTFDDRGIKIKEKIDAFCQHQLMFKENDKIITSMKIILIDEVDIITEKAQQIICELMEKYKSVARFAFTCNNSEKIMNLQTKCNIIRYVGVSSKKMKSRLINICDQEKVRYTEDGIDIIAQFVNGDMREALNCLQTVALNYNIVDENNILKICYIPRPKEIKKMIQLLYNNKFYDAMKIYDDFRLNGYLNINILNSMKTQIYDIKCDEEYRIELIKITYDTIVIINHGNDTYLKMCAYFVNVCQLKDRILEVDDK